MPLDGRAYFGPLPLIPPTYYHPESPAVAEVGAESLRGGFQHIRHAGKLIGHQTYSYYLRSASAYATNLDQLISSSWVDVADFDGAYVPAEATHIYAEAHYRLVNNGPALIYHRIRIDVGGSSDVGAQLVDPRQPAPPNPLVQASSSYLALTLFGPGDPLNSSAIPFVLVNNVRGDLPADARIRVQAYAQSEDGQNVPYTPLFVAAFWASVG